MSDLRCPPLTYIIALFQHSVGGKDQHPLTFVIVLGCAKQICMAAENLFHRIDKMSVISRPPLEDALKQLDAVGDYITDLNYIQKAYKGTTKKETPLPKD